MSFKTVLFAFIILNAKFFCISKNRCDRVRFHWDKRFQFPSVLPKDSEDWKDLVCRFANCLLNSGNSSIKSSRENYQKLNHGSWIDVTFPCHIWIAKHNISTAATACFGRQRNFLRHRKPDVEGSRTDMETIRLLPYSCRIVGNHNLVLCKYFNTNENTSIIWGEHYSLIKML